MNPLTVLLNIRAVRRWEKVHDRDLQVHFSLFEKERFAEFAEAIVPIADDYLRCRRVDAWLQSYASAVGRRCEALIRTGRHEVAEREAAALESLLRSGYPPDGGRYLKVLRDQLAAARRGEPYEEETIDF